MRLTVPTKKRLTLVAAAVLVLTLGACGAPSSGEAGASPSNASASAAGDWPRTVTHANGEATIDAKPARIVNTAMSVTGALLAMDAPVVATTYSTPGGPSDQNGFFTQWADAAVEAGVKPLYQVGEFDLEAVVAADPDLIVVSTSGADSALDHFEELKEIAPTVVVNYGNQTWQETMAELSVAAGTESEAEATLKGFEDHAAGIKERLDIPAGATASVVSYNAGDTSPVGKSTGPHAELLESLGFTVVDPPAEFDTSEQERQDFAFTAYEGLSESLLGDYTFLISATEDTADTLMADKTLANVESVKNQKVYALGSASFRLDYYSATDIVDWFGETFSK